MDIQPYLHGISLNGEIDQLRDPYRAMASRLESLPPEERGAALEMMAVSLSNGPVFLKAVLDTDPTGPAPTEPWITVDGDDDDESQPIDVRPWPDPPSEEAYHGVLGKIVRAIEPNTEADPLALLANMLVMFGNVIGRTAYIQVEATRHYLNEFAVTVGRSALARKGTATDWGRHIFGYADSQWVADRIQAGLSSGEGLISAVRDPQETRSPVRQKGKIVDYQMTVSDPGITDKRLLVAETEFGGVLRALEREGNKLSSVIRLAWDSGMLKTLTKTPFSATDAHVSILGHITMQELIQLLKLVDLVNGFANRFLWFIVRSQKDLPFGGEVPELGILRDALASAVVHAKSVGRIKWTDGARAIWPHMYSELKKLSGGSLGEVLSRGQPHVLRIAGMYTLADGLGVIDTCHLLAAKALWDSSSRCAHYIFGDNLGNKDAEKILKALKDASPNGLTRKEIREVVFQRNKSSQVITDALALLLEKGLIREVKEVNTGGRPAHRYFYGSSTP